MLKSFYSERLTLNAIALEKSAEVSCVLEDMGMAVGLVLLSSFCQMNRELHHDISFVTCFAEDVSKAAGCAHFNISFCKLVFWCGSFQM